MLSVTPRHEFFQLGDLVVGYLTKHGEKAAVSPVKMSLGPVKGAAVRFAPASRTLAIAEGIETALSITVACPGIAVWAALSTSGLVSLDLPGTVLELILCPDGDKAGRSASTDAARRFLSEGRAVRVVEVPDGHDINDIIVS